MACSSKDKTKKETKGTEKRPANKVVKKGGKK